MSQPDYVYGTFAKGETATLVLEKLHKAGFKSKDLSVVGKDCPSFRNLSARIKTPMAKYFVRYGIAGAIGGLWAGTTLAPTIPYVVSFQILTTLMAAISGSIVMAYWGVFLGAFLHANEPQYYANVFEGEIENGEIVVLAEANSKDERRKAFEILDANDALEIIVRQADLGQIIGLDLKPEPGELPGEAQRPQLVAVA